MREIKLVELIGEKTYLLNILTALSSTNVIILNEDRSIFNKR